MPYSLEEKDLKILPKEMIYEIYSYLPVRPNKYDNCIDQINYHHKNFHPEKKYRHFTFHKYILYKNRSKRTFPDWYINNNNNK